MSADDGGSCTASVFDGHGASLWSHSSAQFSRWERLEGSHRAEIIIIGAGITGLSAALHLREKGYDCAVIEADQPGAGASGRSGGLVAPDLIIDTVSSVCKRLGRRLGERMARFVGTSAATTFKLISDYRIECQAQQNGFVVPGPASEAAQLRIRGEEWRSLGFSVYQLDARETRAQIGTSFYTDALRFEEGGALNPLAYAVGLAEVVRAMGAPVFVDSPVIEIKRTPAGWLARTERGFVEGKRVMVAANGGNLKLHPALRNTAVPMSVYEYATRTLTSDEVKSMGNALPYTDRRPYMFSARLNHDSRIISALPGLIVYRKPCDIKSEASRRLARFYPEIENPEVEFIWRGVAYLNRDLLPAVYAPENGTDFLAIQACNGRGIAVNTALGQELAAFVDSGDKDDSLSVPITKPRKIRLYGVAKRVPAILMTIARLKDRLVKH